MNPTLIIDEAVALDEEHRRILQDFGGTYTGLHLAEELSNTLPVVVPRHCTIPVADLDDAALARTADYVRRALAGGFVIKYSGLREGFSAHCVRGAHSSRHRFWDGLDSSAVGGLLRRAMSEAPSGTRLLVLQEIVRHPALAGVLHAYGYEDRVLLEATSPGRRLFAEYRQGAASRCWHVDAPHIGSTGSQPVDATRVATLVAQIRARLGFDVDLEAFGLGDRLVILQLRPIPTDMPVNPQARAIVDRHLTRGSDWHSTPLVWGFWSEGVGTVDLDRPGQPSILLKRTTDLRECASILARLRNGAPTLIVDCLDGFRLSHRPVHLPQTPQLRQQFAYISVAGTAFADLRPGDRVEVYVDGDRGLLRRTI